MFRTLVCTTIAAAAMAASASGQVVISQVYGGGGNSGATFRNDFIEIFNRGTTAQDLTGWSVQYASSSGSSWQVTNLTSVMLMPGQYYLIQQAQGSGGTVNLPTPDATGTISMSATAGKVALVSSGTALTGSCPTDASIQDFVGYGGANCSETAAAPAASNTNAILRGGNGCIDTGNNSTDFTAGAPNPRNTASTLNNCNASATGACCSTLGMCSITTAAMCSGTYQGDNASCEPNPCVPTVGACCSVAGVCTLTTVPGCPPTSAFYGVGVPCTNLNPPCVTQIGACCNNNDGSCFTTLSGNCTMNLTFLGAGTTCTPNMCVQPMGACCTGRTPSATCSVIAADQCTANNFLGAGTTCAPNPCVPPQVVLSQVYGGGGATTGMPTYMQDFVELFNRSAAPIDISGWTLQYASAAGTDWNRSSAFPSGTTLPAGGYFLVKLTQSGTPIGADLTGEDFAPSTSLFLSATNGKVALVRNGSFLTSGCPQAGALVADFIGYGTADCFEGSLGALGLSNTTAAQRAMSGCQDTDDNGADFATGTPTPRNSMTPVNVCSGAGMGACCATDGGCTSTTMAGCTGGTYQGDGTSCTPSNPCPQPSTGACCLTGGGCSVTTATLCGLGNGDYRGNGTSCDPDPCAVSGACCRGSICTQGLQSACTGTFTQFVGANTTCNAPGNFTTPCCKADYNQSGAVTVQDIFDFLSGYFTNDSKADFNGGGIGVQDIFDYLAAYFTGCGA